MLDVVKILQLLKLYWACQLSFRAIGRQLNIADTTVARYVRTAIEKDLTLEKINLMGHDEVKSHFRKRRKKKKKFRMPDFEKDHKFLQSHKAATRKYTYFQYAKIHPKSAYSYSQYCELMHQYRKTIDVVMRQTHQPGECGFLDYAGLTLYWTDPKTAKKNKVQFFLGTLGYSQLIFAYPVASQNSRDWIDAHIQYFKYLGGVPQILVPDNLKAAVIKAGKDPVLNRTYQELANHYDTIIIPARVRKPQDKSLVELSVLYINRWIIAPLSKREFFSLEEIREAVSELLEYINERAFKRYPGSRKTRFLEVEKATLKPLPAVPFEYAEWQSKRKVGRDYHVPVLNHSYSVPYKYVSKYVEAKIKSGSIELFYNNDSIAMHVRSKEQGGATTNELHMPIKHQLYANQSLDINLSWASSVGANACKLIQAQYSSNSNYVKSGNSASSNLKDLARRYGNERFEMACKRAVDIGSLTFTSVKSILQSGYDQLEPEELPTQYIPKHGNIRGPNYYHGESNV